MEKRKFMELTKSKSKAEGRLVILLLGSAFFATVSVNYVISPILPAIGQTFDISVSRAALLVSTYALFYACFALLLGPISDYMERKVIMSLALLGFAVMTFLCGTARSFNQLLVFRAASGMAAATLQPATWAYLADYFPCEKRGTSIAWVMQAGSLALIMGLPLGGLIAQFLGWRWIFFLAALMGAVIAVIIVARLPSFGTHTGAGSHRHEGLLSTIRETYKSLIVHRATRSALLVSFLIWFGFFGQYTYVGALLEHQFGLDSVRIGLVTLAVGVGYILGGQLGGRLSDRIGRKKVILAGLGWLTLVLILLPNVNCLPFAAVGIFAMGFGFFFTYSTQVALISELIPRARGTAMSINYFFTYIGMTAGSAIGGLILAWSDFPFVGLMSAVSCVLAAVVVQSFVFKDQSGAMAAVSGGLRRGPPDADVRPS